MIDHPLRGERWAISVRVLVKKIPFIMDLFVQNRLTMPFFYGIMGTMGVSAYMNALR